MLVVCLVTKTYHILECVVDSVLLDSCQESLLEFVKCVLVLLNRMHRSSDNPVYCHHPVFCGQA